ncbi:hypothetical protein DPQ25_08475 [Hydrogeniiclostridium mannosilyticum]|uniref:Uncharacterized protein n=1 Tax=Hydrogeniiclostridium mannosilyticum TaxID=2764322 RepID=A0A328UD48_9FIRM|nr:hypothetical protein DPQ25_08475 [Hydrogeniiclostridium mannosilyticum]
MKFHRGASSFKPARLSKQQGIYVRPAVFYLCRRHRAAYFRVELPQNRAPQDGPWAGPRAALLLIVKYFPKRMRRWAGFSGCFLAGLSSRAHLLPPSFILFYQITAHPASIL